MKSRYSNIIAKIFFFCAAIFLWIAFKIYWESILPPPEGTSEFSVMLYHHSLRSAKESFSFFLLLGIGTLAVGLYSWFSGKEQWQQTNKIFP
jgi:hypothetical protein